MGNYTMFGRFENPMRHASKKFNNKCSKNSRFQIVFRTDIFQKLSLGAPEFCSALYFTQTMNQLVCPCK